MRFSIRDLFWLTLVVAVGAAWCADRWQQNAKMKSLGHILGVEAIEMFARDWEGTVAAFRNEKSLLRFQVDTLTRELRSRGHRVEIDGCNVLVDRPDFQLQLAPNQQSVKAE
jgi:hypothetical protein